MYSEGGSVVKANNETAFNYFRRAADKVCISDMELYLILASFQHLSNFLVASSPLVLWGSDHMFVLACHWLQINFVANI